ncbi:DNA polymerase II large subunit [Candidatus Woesearchaeota archaeon]|nr:DNA polymerase II large subunit [Candidatus Woesearchaeota archaeon]
MKNNDFPECSESMSKYFDNLNNKTNEAYEIARKARIKGFDPEDKVDIPLARNLAERVEGLISAVAPQLVGKGVPQRIHELEKKFKPLSWEVALLIAEEVAMEKFCKFNDKREAMEVGIRTGFAYHTVGIVSAPLEGFIELLIKKRRDGKEYLAMSYAGPIRAAGGTAAAFSIVLADYIRKVMGYEPYDPDEKEVNRFFAELEDYHERVTNLQYRPSEKEAKFLAQNLPVEITGDPTEKLDVSNYKDLPRIPTNKIRGGMALVLSMVALKAPKIWKELQKWGQKFGINWAFLEDFLKIQKEAKSGKKEKQDETDAKPKILPDNTFIVDLVGGRPVLTHPLAHGGFRLRYGRSRMGGYSAASIHPATMAVLDDYVAIGTQLKVERPGKATAITVCDSVEGPIVLLKNGDVVMLSDAGEAKRINGEVDEILYLGDILFSYGDFLDRNHPLVPSGYCEEWHAQEIEKAIVDMFGTLDTEKVSEFTGEPQEDIDYFLKNPLSAETAAATAINRAEKLNVPMHPRYTYHWQAISTEKLAELCGILEKSHIEVSSDQISKLIIPIKTGSSQKRSLELIGLPHKMATEDTIIEGNDAEAFLRTLGITARNHSKENITNLKNTVVENKSLPILDLLEKISGIKIRDKSGTFIGARMGRPEKAKMRKLIGAPNVLFPVGDEGGRMRSFQSVLSAGKVTADFPIRYCQKCRRDTVFNICDLCGSRTEKRYFCPLCGIQPQDSCPIHGKDEEGKLRKNKTYFNTEIPFKELFERTLKKLGFDTAPDLIKGVKGTSNKDHLPEHLAKGILRAHHSIAVNKDGTTRYDMSEIPITHFKPKEIGVSASTLKELGYEKDCHGNEIENDDQILELKPQDVILPAGKDTLDAPATEVMLNVAKFVDDLLVRFYETRPFYNANKPEDLIGQLIIGLAPHISAGIIGRIIGFSQTAGMLCHPLYHAAMRRDCDGDESCVMLLMDALLNFSRQFLPDNRGGRTMDAPLVLTAILNPAEVDDMVHKVDIAWKYPLQFYEAAQKISPSSSTKIERIGDFLGTPKQYEGMGFTHDTSDINKGTHCSAYKTLINMEEKLKGQMELARKIRAVNTSDVARLVIDKHFMKDTRGNLRKFSMQKFRCSNCNESYRRPPLVGRCTKCGGRLIFTISEGTIVKYLEPSISLAENYNCDDYIKDSLYLIKFRLDQMFGHDKEKQIGLGAWFG